MNCKPGSVSECGYCGHNSDVFFRSELTNRSPTASDALEDEVQEALPICGGDAVAALGIAVIANAFLKAEIDRRIR